MAPLGPGVVRRNSNPRAGAFSPYDTHNIQTINTNGEQAIETFTLNSFLVLFKCKYGANIVQKLPGNIFKTNTNDSCVLVLSD